MMNHQGGMSHSNCNANNQNKVNHQSTGALEFLPTASSLTAGGYQRFPDQVLGSNHVSPSIGCSAGVAPQNVDSGAEYAGNNCYNNLNVSLTLGLHSYGPENENTSNSYTTVIDHGRSSSTVQEQGLNSSSMYMRRLSCKRKSPEHTVRDFLVGESSSAAAHAGTSKRQASEVYGSNSLNISTPYTSPVSHQEQSETIICHGTITPDSDMQHLNGARLSENFQSNIHHHTAANQQAFPPTSILSSGYMRNAHVQLPSQSPLYGQDNYPPFFRPAERVISPISSVQPDEHVPYFQETSQAPPCIHMMRSSSGFSSFLPVYTAAESAAVAPFHYPRNINENIMFSHQIGRRNWAHDARTLHFVDETANFPGNFFCPRHGFVPDTTHSANAPVSFTGFNFADPYALTTSRIVNHPVLATTGFPWHSYSPVEVVLQEMGYAVGFGNAVSQNQHILGARSENYAAYYTWSLANAQISMGLMPEDLHTSEARFENQDIYHLYHYFWSAANAQNRRRLSLELHHRLTLLHSVDLSRPVIIPPELRMLDHSVVTDLVMGLHNEDEPHLDSDNWNNEDAGGPEEGLSEEMVLGQLRQEKFQSIPNGSEENECCCICQEEYQEDEDLGKLWCGHRFHADCIKPWLVLKNVCPICKQTALPICDDSL
ncbi:hypothetical protein K1719_015486 [Acacia pycnantha]|nr:hypothetical protein K1719_015486 [Acacia pycnantha]